MNASDSRLSKTGILQGFAAAVMLWASMGLVSDAVAQQRVQHCTNTVMGPPVCEDNIKLGDSLNGFPTGPGHPNPTVPMWDRPNNTDLDPNQLPDRSVPFSAYTKITEPETLTFIALAFNHKLSDDDKWSIATRGSGSGLDKFAKADLKAKEWPPIEKKLAEQRKQRYYKVDVSSGYELDPIAHGNLFKWSQPLYFGEYNLASKAFPMICFYRASSLSGVGREFKFGHWQTKSAAMELPLFNGKGSCAHNSFIDLPVPDEKQAREFEHNRFEAAGKISSKNISMPVTGTLYFFVVDDPDGGGAYAILTRADLDIHARGRDNVLASLTNDHVHYALGDLP